MQREHNGGGIIGSSLAVKIQSQSLQQYPHTPVVGQQN
jgi:hypothetical protein